MRRGAGITLFALALLIAGLASAAGCFRGYLTAVLPGAAADVADLKVPPGFAISVFAADVPNARQMALGPDGIVFVGSRAAGKVYAIANGKVHVLASDLQMPSGIAWRDGSLYVAAVSRVLRFRDVAKRLTQPPPPEVVSSAFPTDGHHGWKFIAFGPDGKLYVPVGAPCNVCEPPGPLHATITRVDLAGGKPEGRAAAPEVVARGVRNTVGFDFHPRTGELWFTDNGRDWMGNDQPPDELNRLTKPGEHFGYPYCHGKAIRDPEFGSGQSCDQYTAPVHELGPHVAAIGMRFYTGTMFPEKYRGGVFIAEHGSWNRSTAIGYRVSFVQLDGTRAVAYESFAEGWLRGTIASGRPADVLVMPDGALLVSDDKAGRIYRITYRR
jgi:glucose/arabinose dehydrogenase